MTQPFKDHFSGMAGAYQAFRPGYPPALFEWLATLVPRLDVAADLGCGSGQASLALARHFAEVLAIEPSAEQVARAEPHPRVRYRVAPAEATGLPDGSVDLAIAAQAFHWFEPDPFRRELERIARPGAAFAAFTYALCRIDPAVDAVIDRLYRDLLGAHWPPERRHVDSGYRTLPFPWAEIAAPSLEIAEEWDLGRFVGYLGTWSAVAAFRRALGRDPIAEVLPALQDAWGPPGGARTVRWPLTIRAGRV